MKKKHRNKKTYNELFVGIMNFFLKWNRKRPPTAYDISKELGCDTRTIRKAVKLISYIQSQPKLNLTEVQTYKEVIFAPTASEGDDKDGE